jgi:hypothetical protein
MTALENSKRVVDILKKYSPNTKIFKVRGTATHLNISRPNSPLIVEIFLYDDEIRYQSQNRRVAWAIKDLEHFAKSWANWSVFDANWDRLFNLSNSTHYGYDTNAWSRINKILSDTHIFNIIDDFTSDGKTLEYTLCGVRFKMIYEKVAGGIISLDGYEIETTAQSYNSFGGELLVDTFFPQSAIRQAKLNKLLS